MKNELKVSDNSLCLFTVLSLFLFAIIMVSMLSLKIVGLLFSKIFNYRLQLCFQIQKINVLWLQVEQLHKGFMAYCIVA